MSALDRKLLRDLWHIRGIALAIALVIGAGLATFVMSLGAINSLSETRTAYYERYRFAEVFAQLKRAPQRLMARIENIPGVKRAEDRIVKGIILDLPDIEEPATGALISIPEKDRRTLNDIALREGRYISPGRPDEVIISEAFAEAHRFRPGARFGAILNGRKRTLQVVGIALSPEYVYSIAPGSLMPDDERFGVLWMSREALAAAFDLDGAFNDVSLTLLRGANVESVIADLDRILERYGGTGAIARRDQTSDWFVTGEIEQLKKVATVLPSIFIAVSVFLLNMTVSRLISTEREQIGLLKAFGYGDLAVGWHYVKLVLLLTALGIAAGFVFGVWLGREITQLYAEHYRFPLLYYRPGAGAFALGALLCAAGALLGTLNAVRRAVTIPPAQAMVPPAPPLYRRGLLMRLGVRDTFDQPTLMILRRASRWPLRTAFTTLGIAAAVAVLLASLHWLDAIEYMVEVQFFQLQRQDMTVALTETRADRALREIAHLPGVLAAEPYRAVAARFRLGHRSHLDSITGVPEGAELAPVRDVDGRLVALPADGLVLSKKLAELLGARRGDRVTVEVLQDRRPVRDLRVVDIVDTLLGTPAYMRRDALNRLMREGPSISGVHLQVDPAGEADVFRELKSTPMVTGTVLRNAAVRSFRETMAETIDIIVAFYVGFAALLAGGVVYNSVRISLSERGRELATLRVLGFTRREISYILLGELALVTFLALPLGCLLGYGLAYFMTRLFETELYRIPFVIDAETYGFAVLVVALTTVLAGALVRRRLDRLDLIAVLKTRE